MMITISYYIKKKTCKKRVPRDTSWVKMSSLKLVQSPKSLKSYNLRGNLHQITTYKYLHVFRRYGLQCMICMGNIYGIQFKVLELFCYVPQRINKKKIKSQFRKPCNSLATCAGHFSALGSKCWDIGSRTPVLL